MENTKLKLYNFKSAESKDSVTPSEVIPKGNLQTPLKNEMLKSEIVKSISTGECTVPEDLVTQFGLTYDQAIGILSDPQFLSNLKNYTKAKLSLNFHSSAVPRLMEIVKSEDNKEAIQAIKLAAQLSDNLKSAGTDVNINLNLEQMVKATEKVVNPTQNINAEPIIDLERVS